MFENQSEVVQKLLTSNAEFRRLYDKHAALKARVRRAQRGTGGLGDQDLGTMKKQKLQLKDQMAGLIDRFEHNRAVS